MLEEGREMQEELQELERELRADPEIDWEQEEELRDALRKQEEMAEQLEELSRGLEQRADKLGENEMIREDVAEKLDRIQKLVEELRETEAGEILRRFQEMVAEMDPEGMPDELKQLRMDQEQLLEQLARTEAMLEQIMREQRMDALLEQVDELLEQQEQLRAETETHEEQSESEDESDTAEPGDEETEGAETEGEETDGEQDEEKLADAAEQNDAESEDGAEEKSDDKDAEELAERQKELADAAKELAEKIREEAETLAEEFPEESESMKESVEKESESNPTPPMDDAAQKLEDSESGASEDQQDASLRLLKLYWRMMQAQAGMSSSVDQAATEAIGQVTRQTLEMSLREENQQTEMQRRLFKGQNLEAQRASARKQMNLYLSMDRIRGELLEAAKVSFMISRRAMQASQAALEAMETSIAELEAGAHRSGLAAAGEAVAHLNVTVIELLEGVQAQGQGGSGSCDNPMQSMQDMLKQQEQLNKDSRSQGKSPGMGGLSMQERSRMQRLKAEQQAIREGIEEMASGEEELLGRLDKIIEDMKEIEKDFAGGRITEETLKRQEKIFERMLDAQRSVHQREYKQQRRSRSADDLAPLWSDEEIDDPLEKLREEIRRGLGDAAPPEYEGLIQEYYRSLLERNKEVLP